MCPICHGNYRTNDASVIEKRGNRVTLRGRINAVATPDDAHFPPFSDWFTVPLYPKGRVKYLKFEGRAEQDKWGFERNQQVRCEGCLHIADGKELVFDITLVELME